MVRTLDVVSHGLPPKTVESASTSQLGLPTHARVVTFHEIAEKHPVRLDMSTQDVSQLFHGM